MLTLRALPPEAVRPMRALVLRPGAPPDTLVYPGDDEPRALHVGAFEAEALVGVATVYPEPPPDLLRGLLPETAYAPDVAFRLRGMATHPEAQGRGIGRAVLEHGFAHVLAQGGGYLWCNARTGARAFYERLGLDAFGEEFEIPGIGPHFVMGRPLG